MDTQPARERAVRIRTQPKHAPQTFRLMIDIQDNLPPRELVYRNDESGLDTAMAFVRKHKLDNDLTVPIWDAITKRTGGRLFGLVEMEDSVTAAPTTKPLPSSRQAEFGEFVTAEPESANESPCQALDGASTPLQSLIDDIDDWRKTSQRLGLGIPTPPQMIAAPTFDSEPPVARLGREINESRVRKCTPSFIVSPFATPRVQTSHAHPRLATGTGELENGVSRRKLVHMSNTMLKTEVRVGALETQFENLDISKTAHGQSEDIQALQKMVAKLVKENVSLRARLARLEKRDDESMVLKKTVVKLTEENVDLGARLAISEGLVETTQDVVL
ncbi:hypothetical protein LTR17_006510 [Elasticomyces elasticus]|nr:hypothetical protein LTR17_006510 [Elasticomyces elasticus]